MTQKELVKNRRAFYDYDVIDTIEAGIVLLGTEIKSLRAHGGSLQDAYITIKEHEAWLINSTIAAYSHGNIHNHPEKRERKLLLHKNEILKLQKMQKEKGMTLIPLALFWKKNLIKVKVGVAKGKKSHDKRSAIKEKEQKKSIQRALKDL